MTLKYVVQTCFSGLDFMSIDKKTLEWMLALKPEFAEEGLRI